MRHGPLALARLALARFVTSLRSRRRRLVKGSGDGRLRVFGHRLARSIVSAWPVTHARNGQPANGLFDIGLWKAFRHRERSLTLGLVAHSVEKLQVIVRRQLRRDQLDGAQLQLSPRLPKGTSSKMIG